MKRLSTLMVILLVLGTVLTACGGAATEAPADTHTEAPTEAPADTPTEAPADTPTEAPADTPTEAPASNDGSEDLAALTIWADDTRAPVLEKLSKDFQDKYGVPVAVQLVDFGDISENLQVAAPAGEGPDIIIGAHDWLGALVTSGILSPIELGDKKDSFLPAAIQAFTYEGQLYGMPYAVENVGFFRNTELVPEAPKTWTEVMEISEKLEAENKVKLGYALQIGDGFHFFPIQTAFGGYVFGVDENGSYDPNDVGIDSEGTIAAAQWLETMAQNGHVQEDLDWDTMHSLFENGEAAMMISGPWALERIREAGIPYEVTALPGEVKESQPFLGAQGFMISAFSKDPLLAQVFLTEFVATEEVMQAIFESDPRPPAFIPVAENIDDPDLAAFGEAGANGLPMPAIPAMGSVWGAWGDAITLVFQQQQPADEAFKNAGEQIRVAINEK